MRASTASYGGWLAVVTGAVSSRSSSETNASSRSIRSPGVGRGRPSTSASQPLPPAPTPRMRRPSLTSSSVISSLANGTGWRKFGDATHVPRPIRDVTVAAATSVGTVANHGSSFRSCQARWSYVHAWSKPISSTARQRAAASLHRSWGSRTIPMRMRPASPIRRAADTGLRNRGLRTGLRTGLRSCAEVGPGIRAQVGLKSTAAPADIQAGCPRSP